MSKRAGAVSAQTREAILQAAMDEFSSRGFQGSSLRRICAAAGVTTGAIYFFFSGKDELFETILSGVTVPFLKVMKEHYLSEHSFLSKEPEANQDNDLAVSRILIDFYFRNQQAFDILIRHQDYPAVRKFLDEFVDLSTDHYLYLIGLSDRVHPRTHPVDSFAVHQFVHMQVDAMITLISHGFDREEMLTHSQVVTKMLRSAFLTLLAD